MQNKPKT